MKTRRRFWREETVAPWLTLIVIVGLWWAGATLIPRTGASSAPAPTLTVSRAPAAAPAESRDAGERMLPGPDGDRLPGTAPAPALEHAPAAGAPPGGAGSSTARALVPVVGIDPLSLTSTFHEARGGGTRRHEAMDILAPRGTPVVAAVDGRVVKLFTSAAGGLTIYQFDAGETLCYYYAHLDSYAPDLNEGRDVVRGQVIGYVGTTGNAPPDTPHLHFAVYRLGADKRWWEGEPLDPITLLR